MSLFQSQNVFSGYKTANVLQGVTLQINSGEMIAVIGRNGVGKTTFIKTIIGLIEIRSGEIFFDDNRLNNLATYERAKLGIGYVPQGREIFPQLSVKDNLRMGGFLNEKQVLNYELVFSYFPFIKDRLNQRGGTLSGGQQEMLSIARALIGEPKLLILDEPSEGVQPSIVQEISEFLIDLNSKHNISVLFVEQNIYFVKNVANRGYVMNKGVITSELNKEQLFNEDFLASQITI